MCVCVCVVIIITNKAMMGGPNILNFELSVRLALLEGDLYT